MVYIQILTLSTTQQGVTISLLGGMIVGIAYNKINQTGAHKVCVPHQIDKEKVVQQKKYGYNNTQYVTVIFSDMDTAHAKR